MLTYAGTIKFIRMILFVFAFQDFPKEFQNLKGNQDGIIKDLDQREFYLVQAH